jgi:lactoylglutathione lyase
MSDGRRLIVVILHVKDLDASVRFYRDLLGIPLAPGVNEPLDDRWYGGHHAEISWREGAYLHFALFPARPPALRTTTGAEVGLLVEDAHAVHPKLVAGGATVLHPPRPEPWGATARYLDPDGNIVGVTSR